MNTSHGHHIPGTPENNVVPIAKARCGGVGLCNTCSREAGIARHPAGKKRGSIADIQTPVIIHLTESKENPVAVCTGLPFSIPPHKSGERITLCNDCRNKSVTRTAINPSNPMRKKNNDG